MEIATQIIEHINDRFPQSVILAIILGFVLIIGFMSLLVIIMQIVRNKTHEMMKPMMVSLMCTIIAALLIVSLAFVSVFPGI